MAQDITIHSAIRDIENAELPGSVTNRMVARVMKLLSNDTEKLEQVLTKLEKCIDNSFVYNVTFAATPADVELALEFVNPVKELEGEVCSAMPMATEGQAGFMSAQMVKDLHAGKYPVRRFLTIDAAGRLVAHGCGELLDAGLTPVLFRRLRRNNRLADGVSRRRETRWTRFTAYDDAVAVDRGTGVVSFRTDLLEPEYTDSHGRVTSADALVLRRSDLWVVYGRARCFPCMLDADSMRMLRFPFVLGFVGLSENSATRRYTLADCAACMPFFVRYTPLHYYRGDEEVSTESLSDFTFNLA